MKRSSRVRGSMILANGLILVACSGAVVPLDPDTSSGGPGAFWSALRIKGDEAEGFASLRGMRDGANAVVTGHFGRRLEERLVQGDMREDRVAYHTVELVVERVIDGRVDDDVVPMEFMWQGRRREGDGEEWTVDALPEGPMVVFLRAKRGRGEEGRYRAVNSYGLWAESARDSLDTPLSETNARVEGPYAEELRGVDTVQELIAWLAES